MWRSPKTANYTRRFVTPTTRPFEFGSSVMCIVYGLRVLTAVCGTTVYGTPYSVRSTSILRLSALIRKPGRGVSPLLLSRGCSRIQTIHGLPHNRQAWRNGPILNSECTEPLQCTVYGAVLREQVPKCAVKKGGKSNTQSRAPESVSFACGRRGDAAGGLVS